MCIRDRVQQVQQVQQVVEQVKHFPTMYAVATNDIQLFQDEDLKFPIERKIQKDEILVLQNQQKFGNRVVFQTYFINDLTNVESAYFVGFDNNMNNVTNLSLIPIQPNRIDISSI